MHVAIYVCIYLYMHVYIHTQAREEVVFPNSLENLWDSPAVSALLLFKENLCKKLMCSQKLPSSN